jgi:endonuclease/exonuclease/phosphatase (EEP) superfamily protein YafD
VPARLDWLAGRGVTPVAATTIDPRPLASDHAAIVVDLSLQ